ncbi:MAG: co-chaperone GroES [Bacteroidetes bacterium 4572_77]|nr:MAG: co-chaperone GroES [Bacteroidetes bacterium 4572_77]
MKIRPLGERVIIAPQAAETKTASGIIIPDTAKEKPLQGTVLATGKTADGNDLEVKIDDKVLYGKFAGTEIELEGNKYLIMEQSDILAVL